MKKLTSLVLFFPLICLAVEKTDVSDADTFKGEQLVLKKKMEELFEASKKINSDKEKAKARTFIESSLDWDRVAQLCLGSAEWKKQSAKNRGDFKNLLKDVVIQTAYSRLDKFWEGTTYQFQKIEVKGSNAEVLAQFTVNGEVFGLEYFFSKRGKAWAIYDIAYENERYSVNINEQIDGFLREKNFSVLLDKLRKRLQELNEQSKTKKT